jgi:eukaryotic-like serine/threonine-protein kinase
MIKGQKWQFHGDAARTGIADELIKPPLKKAWEFQTEERIQSSPVVSNGTVFFGDTSGTFYALNAHIGHFLWKQRTQGPILSQPVADQNAVYFRSMDNSLYALNRSTGEQIWRFQDKGVLWPGTSPLLVGDFICLDSDALYMLDVWSGNVVWKLEGEGNSGSSPALSEGILYAGIYKTVHAIDIQQKRILWRQSVGSKITAGPVIRDGLVFVGTMSWHLIALSALTGQIIWIFNTPDPERFAPIPRIESYPAVSDQYLFFGAPNGAIYALDKQTGDEVWMTYIGVYLASSPLISGNYLYILGCDGRLYALDARNGDKLWSHYSPVNDNGKDWLSSSPVIYDGKLYVGWDKIYAFEESNIDIDNVTRVLLSSDRSARLATLDEIKTCGDYRLIAPLTKMLKDDDIEIRKKALEIILIFNDDRTWALSLECLFEMDPDNRGKQFVDVVIMQLHHSNKMNRIAAANILRSLNNSKAVDPLKSALQTETDQDVRRLIARALGDIK